MPAHNGLNEKINLRISDEEKAKFLARCDEFGVAPQVMLREMIEAFSKNCLTIKVPPTQLRILKGVHDVVR